MNLETFDFDALADKLCEHFGFGFQYHLRFPYQTDIEHAIRKVLHSDLQDGDGGLMRYVNAVFGYNDRIEDTEKIFEYIVHLGMIKFHDGQYHLNSAIYEDWKAKQ